MKVQILSEGECWLWLAGKHTRGYGRFMTSAKAPVNAHVYSLELKLGRKLEKGEVCRHTCDNRLCCNPKHLLLGTQADNMQDARQRSKMGSGNTAKGWATRRAKYGLSGRRKEQAG